MMASSGAIFLHGAVFVVVVGSSGEGIFKNVCLRLVVGRSWGLGRRSGGEGVCVLLLEGTRENWISFFFLQTKRWRIRA